jgi:predicted  nucleic acid-binding Zn-ribbon protein
MFLQKLLSRIRVMTLKLENKTGNYLTKLREQEKQKIEEASGDNYWNDLKKIIKSKDGLRKKVAAVEKKANAVVEKVSEIKSGVTEEKKKRRKKITMMF